MFKYSIVLITLFVFTSCGSQSTNDSKLIEQIKAKEDSISKISCDLRPGQLLPKEVSEELIDLLLLYFSENPKNAYSAECLQKVHMIYSSTKEYQKSADYGDTLLANFPDYINRPLILESMATSYDIYISPRDTNKIRHYNELLLEENPDLPAEKVEGIKFKLDNLELSLEEIIMKANQ